MKKKILLFLILSLFLSLSCYVLAENREQHSSADIEEAWDSIIKVGAADSARVLLPVYQKLLTCTSANTQDFVIYGKELNKCHFKYVNYDCMMPMDVTRKYAQASIKVSREAIAGNFDMSSEDVLFVNSLLENQSFCKQSDEPQWHVINQEY